MDLLSDKEIAPIKDVEKLVRIADSTLSDVVKKHVKKAHIMAPSEQRKGYFFSSGRVKMQT